LVKNAEEDDVKDGDQNAPISLKETSILTTFSGILFAFLLRIATSPPKEFSLFDRFVILMALYASCIAISFFIMPAISHQLHDRLSLERYMKRMRTFMKIGSVAAIIAVFLSLGIALSGLFAREIAYVFAALPFVIAGMVIWKK
jgi:hypothetical protein